MFYCKQCGKERDWPESLLRSEGPCEICGHVRICSDVASKNLPIPGKTMEQTAEHEQKMTRLDRALMKRVRRMRREGDSYGGNDAA